MRDALLDADEIRAASFVRHVEIHDTLGSTNDRAAELARDATIEVPALVVARHQTAGRGRGKNTWWAADGALTFSVLLEPASIGIRTFNWPQLSLATAVAVCDSLELLMADCGLRIERNNPQSAIRNPQSSPPLAIKWPNDIMLGERKAGGILIESPGGAAPAKDRLVIGIGINVNNSWHNAPQEIKTHAVAICDVTGEHHNPMNLVVHILVACEKRARQLAAEDKNSPNPGNACVPCPDVV